MQAPCPPSSEGQAPGRGLLSVRAPGALVPRQPRKMLDVLNQTQPVTFWGLERRKGPQPLSKEVIFPLVLWLFEIHWLF